MKIESLLSAETEQMSDGITEMFLFVTLKEESKEEIHKDILGLFGFQVLKKRLEYYKIPVNDYVIAFVSIALCNGNPGKCVMWAYTFHKIYKKENREIGISLLTKYFPYGFPKENEYERLWDAQKMTTGEFTGNALDMNQTWE